MMVWAFLQSERSWTASLGHLDGSGAQLGCNLGSLGPQLGALGPKLDALGPHLGPKLAALGPKVGEFRAEFGKFARILANFDESVRFWPNLARSKAFGTFKNHQKCCTVIKF